jgi:DNA-binding MarR family transcriptional regulator
MSDKGFIVLSNKVVRSERLDVYEKALFSVILSYNGCEDIYPSHTTLSKQTGMSRSQIIRTQKKLVKKGYLKVKKSPSYRSNLYSVTEKGVSDRNINVSDSDRGCVSQTQGGVSHSDTNNISINNISIKEKKSIKEKSPARNNGLPGWLDKEIWAEWIKYRKQRGSTLTPSTISAQLKKLEKYQKDHVKIIEQSIEHGWIRLVYELKEQGTRNNRGSEHRPSNFIEAEEGKYDHLDD